MSDAPTQPPSTTTSPRPLPLGISLAISLGLAVLGQLTLATNWDKQASLGVILYAGAIGVYLWSSRSIPNWPNFQASGDQLERRQPPFALWLTPLVLTLWLIFQVNEPTITSEQARLMAILWPVSAVLFSWSVLRMAGWRFPQLATINQGWRKHSYEILAVVLLVCLAFALRIYNLELHPYAMVNDEGEVGKQALLILSGERTNLFDAGWGGQPAWSFAPDAVTTWLFGRNAFAVRLVSAVQGTLAVLFLFFLAREIFDSATGLLAAGILATLPFHIHFSRLGVCNGGDAFFVTLVLWLTIRAIRRGKLSSYLWAGLAAGLTLYTYLGSRLVMALALGTLGYAILYYRMSWQAHLRQWVVFIAALGIVAAPIGVYFLNHPEWFMSRINDESIFNNGWLSNRLAEGNLTAALVEQVGRSTLVFIASDAPAGFYNAPRPYFPPMAAILGMLGLGYAFWRMKEPRYMMLLAWFWAVVLLGSASTTGPPTSQRLIMSAPAAALFVALGVRKTASMLQAVVTRFQWLGMAVSILCVFITAVQGVTFYFVEYPNGHYFEDHSNELTYEASRYADSLGSDYQMFLIGAPTVLTIFGNFGYLARDNHPRDLNEVTPETVAALPRQGGAFFVAFPTRQQDLQKVADLIPGGTWLETPRRYRPGEVLYYAYLVPPEVFEGR